MPRLPGRESTKREIEIENAEVVSFIFEWEPFAKGKRCSIIGCDHKLMGERTDKVDPERGPLYWEMCEGKPIAAGGAVGADKRITDKRGPRYYFCPCCVLKITEGNDG